MELDISHVCLVPEVTLFANTRLSEAGQSTISPESLPTWSCLSFQFGCPIPPGLEVILNPFPGWDSCLELQHTP